MASPRLERTATPGIYKRGGRYVAVFRDPSGRQRKVFGRTLSEARRLKAEKVADVSRGEYRQFSRVPFADYALEWIETYQGRTARGFGDGSRDDYRDTLERDAIPFFGRTPLPAVEPRDAKRYVKHLTDRGLAASSVRKTVAPVRALFATAVEEGLIRSNPFAGVRIAQPTVDDIDGDEQVKALTDDERARLLEAIDVDWRPFFGFLFETGLRISEAIEVRHRDVDGAWLRVDRRFYRGRLGLPKGRKRRRVPLSTPMAQTLWTMRRDAKPDDLLFTSAKGARIDPSNLMARVLKPAAVAAGLGEIVEGTPTSWVGFHTFRHSCATALFRRGWNAVQVQKFLGHADAGFTLRTYVHLLPEDLPEPDFAALEMGNERATEGAEIATTEPSAAVAEIAV
jgi:integrase